MKKYLAAIAVLAPVLTILPAAPASADSVCAPVTIDGQPVCQDVTPIEQGIATAEATAVATAAYAEATALAEYAAIWNLGGPVTFAIGAEFNCQRWAPASSTSTLYIEAVLPNATNDYCNGSEITVQLPQPSAPGLTRHVHVPQVCVTTVNLCVGPVDQDVQVPVTLSAVAVCSQPIMIGTNGYREYTGSRTCTSVPLA
jgi:hypothetical protein